MTQVLAMQAVSLLRLFIVFVCLNVHDVVSCEMSHQCRVEQRSVIKFLVKQGATPIQCWRQLQAVYGNRSLGKTQTRAWHKMFKQGDLDTAVKDKPRSGRGQSGRSPVNIQAIQAQVEQDRCQSVREIAAETGISCSTVQRILRKDLRL